MPTIPLSHRIILASGSPRRQQFLKDLLFDFDLELKPIEENYPPHLQKEEITEYLAQLKASPFEETLQEKEIVITSDTIVWHENKAYGKPKDEAEAFEMLRSYSGKVHQVISSVCFTTKKQQITKSYTTDVFFKPLQDSDIQFYIEHFKPMDKAGAYGIQEWIGLIGIEKINGSYFNVVGMPCHLVYETLLSICNQEK